MFSWSYFGAGLLLCSLLLNQYSTYPDLTIREVLGGSLFSSIAFASIITVVARRHVFSTVQARITTDPLRISSIASGFNALSSKMRLANVSLREATHGSAFSMSLDGKGIVAMSPEMATSLSEDEAEAVLAHELSHIRNGDPAAKGLAHFARVAFLFDPLLPLVEAAVHRERELWADRAAVEFTRKPLALASALLKANSGSYGAGAFQSAGMFVGGHGRGLLSRHPDLERRVDILLDLARLIEIPAD